MLRVDRISARRMLNGVHLSPTDRSRRGDPTGFDRHCVPPPLVPHDRVQPQAEREFQTIKKTTNMAKKRPKKTESALTRSRKRDSAAGGDASQDQVSPDSPPIKHIFVSHAGPDRDIADKLASDLRDAGHETRVDTRELQLGDDSIDFMNQAIAEAHTVLILYSSSTPKARWQKLEINASLWNEIAQDGGTCIVIRLDDSEFPPILGPKVYGKLSKTSGSEYLKLLEDICKAILPRTSATSIVSAAFGSDSENPFRRLRAEFFEDSPELLARTFAPPDASKVGALEDKMPCILEGSRGTGKSMLLLSLRARNYLARTKTLGKSIPIFGAYLKLTPGALCNAGRSRTATSDPQFGEDLSDLPLVDVSAQEIFISIMECVISEIDYCLDSEILPCERGVESRLAEAIGARLFRAEPERFRRLADVRERLSIAHEEVSDYIRKRFIYGETLPVPFTHFDLKLLKDLLAVIRREVACLSNALFAVLLDEYENLFPFQQRVINGLVKLAAPELTVKIAKKLGTFDTPSTVTGQDLQEINDYKRIPLVYDLDDAHELRAYRQLLEKFVTNTLCGSSEKPVSLDQLLPTFSSVEVDEEAVRTEVAKLCKKTSETFDKWELSKQREKLTYYGVAAVYRCLYGGARRRQEKQFAGKDDLTLLSSGIIRYFQEFLGVAYHLAFASNRPDGTPVIPPEFQSRAVHLVSKHNIATLSRNVEAYGEVLRYLLLDLGDGLRHRLLRHTSEPEAARLTVTDPERLSQPQMGELRRILSVGVREGVFQSKEGVPAFRPKHDSDPQPVEFNVCRLFAPALQISPRLRWRSEIECEDLAGLIEPDTRAFALGALKKKWGGGARRAKKPKRAVGADRTQSLPFTDEEDHDESDE